MLEGTETRHPARFTDVLIPVFDYELRQFDQDYDQPIKTILDPFAGVGGIHTMRKFGYYTDGIELEPEWAEQSPWTEVGDALHLPFEMGHFDAVVTSPCYGNRMADHHEARDDSRRNTYRHALGRPLSDGSAAGLQWGDEYREFHILAWRETYRVVRPGGAFVLNIKDHIRGGIQQGVPEWHVQAAAWQGWRLSGSSRVNCPGNRQGANGQDRIPFEWVFTFRKPTSSSRYSNDH